MNGQKPIWWYPQVKTSNALGQPYLLLVGGCPLWEVQNALELQ